MTQRLTSLLGLFVILSFFVFAQSVDAGKWEALGNYLQKKQTLSEDEIIQGLKQALEIGTTNTIDVVSGLDGYYKNPKIKIPLPQEWQRIEELLRKAGLGPKVDEFVLSMNRAAEQAAPKARPIFWDAIKAMRFEDAKKILEGRENEATLYFKDKTFNPLQEAFQPLIHHALSEVGVTRLYQDLDDRMQMIPFLQAYHFDLDQYVTQKALDGLFSMLAEEEKKIRENPAARVTELLKKVFGWKE